MEEDILNYLPTVRFRGTPCRSCSVLEGDGTKNISNKKTELFRSVACEVSCLWVTLYIFIFV